jgi:tetratricopeptide (TPR) repeat protein
VNCRRAQRELSAWLDGESRCAAAVDEHLAGCAACRALAAELRGVVAAVRDLPACDAPATVFARAAGAAARSSARTHVWWIVAAAPAAVAATVALVVWLRASRPLPPPAPPVSSTADRALLASAAEQFARAEEHYRRAVDQLRRLSVEHAAAWASPRRQAHLRELDVIEDAVARLRGAARVAPADPATQELLFAAYRRQLVALQEAIFETPATTVDEGSRE